MFSSVLLQIEQVSVQYIKVNIKSGIERRSIVQYNFCVCGEAYPDPVRAETRKVILFVDKHQIPSFEIDQVIENNQESIEGVLQELISFELTEESQLRHIFNKAIKLYNFYNGSTISYHTDCTTVLTP